MSVDSVGCSLVWRCPSVRKVRRLSAVVPEDTAPSTVTSHDNAHRICIKSMAVTNLPHSRLFHRQPDNLPMFVIVSPYRTSNASSKSFEMGVL